MEIKITPHVTDPIPGELYDAYNNIQATDHPCIVCKRSNTNIRDHYHGSDLGACARKVAYKMLDPTLVRSFSSTNMFLQDGHLHEKSILDAFRSGLPDGWKVEHSETEDFYWRIGNYNIHCHIDGLLIDPQGEKYLLECKSVKEYTWKKVNSGEISDEWYGQMQAYLAGLDLYYGYLCVKNRTTSQLLMPIRIARNEEWIIDRCNDLLEIQSVKTPSKVTRKYDKSTSSECRFCPWKEECWKDEQ